MEKAAVLMLEGHFGGLPVLDDDDRVVGIITDSDIFKVLVEISGVYEGGAQVCLTLFHCCRKPVSRPRFSQAARRTDHEHHDPQRP